jgi:hypothetical protein
MEGILRELRLNLIGCAGAYLSIYSISYKLTTSREAVTPNQDFIISPHPHCKNLFIATGGSFHAWKFLPIIGKYVVKMLDGLLDEVAARRWAWDRENDGAACVMYIPKRDLKDIEGYSDLMAESNFS